MILRKHQKETETVIDGIINGSGVKKIVGDVVPGGGKSTIPIQACRLISAGLADKICWIVPRTSLKDQGERGFLNPDFRKLFNHRYTVRSSTNEINPSRGTNGFITTFQAVGTDDRRTVEREFSRHRYILVLDEFHHIVKGGAWEKTIAPLIESSAFVILMTGTMARGDGEPIAFMDYRKNGFGFEPCADSGSAVIRYPRSAALAEKAILPLEFHCHDGAVSWRASNGREVDCKSLAEVNQKDATAAIYTAVDTKYAEELLDAGVGHWLRHKKEANPNSKALVITANIGHARQAIDTLKRFGMKADLATSHESLAARKAIRRFTGYKSDLLVTIAMAYEGLDVPAITHEISLTRIRSAPWIEQMVARAVRVDPQAGPYESQTGYVFCPDDPLMRAIISKIETEQAPYLDRMERGRREKEILTAEQLELFDDIPPVNTPGGIIPLASRMTSYRQLLVGTAGGRVDTPAIITEKEREDSLRRDIDRHVKDYARHADREIMHINAELKRFFGKPRESMTRPELERLMAYLQRFYGRKVCEKSVA